MLLIVDVNLNFLLISIDIINLYFLKKNMDVISVFKN